jgi:predicted Fe-Mo cluster-binding NifX family protein
MAEKNEGRGKGMKIAITSHGAELTSMMDPRFGRAQGFLIYDTDRGSSEYLDNSQVLDAAHGAGIQAAKTIIKAGAEALITGSVGPNAHETLSAAGIAIFSGAKGTVQEAIGDYRAGKLVKADGPDSPGHV